jgi:preprotein translocase subunit SecG
MHYNLPKGNIKITKRSITMKKIVSVLSVLVFALTLTLTVTAREKDNPFEKILKNIDSIKTKIRSMNPNKSMKKIKKLKEKLKKEQIRLDKTFTRVTLQLNQKIDMLEEKQERLDPEKDKEKLMQYRQK